MSFSSGIVIHRNPHTQQSYPENRKNELPQQLAEANRCEKAQLHPSAPAKSLQWRLDLPPVFQRRTEWFWGGDNRQKQQQHLQQPKYQTQQGYRKAWLWLVMIILVLLLVQFELRMMLHWRREYQEGLEESAILSMIQDECSSSSQTTTQTRTKARATTRDNRKNINKKNKIPLIIGGSDGSGTRSIVHVIQQLGVTTVIADDPITMDFHAGLSFHHEGWPGLVRRVLVETRGSANYQWTDLSEVLHVIITPQLLSLVHQQLEPKCQHMKEQEYYRNHRPQQQQQQQRVSVTTTSDISYAMKAPISMLVWPILTHFLSRPKNEDSSGGGDGDGDGDDRDPMDEQGNVRTVQSSSRIKFLHVIRDGRDVALSTNQSPVTKFYNITYLNHDDDENNNKQEEDGPSARFRDWSQLQNNSSSSNIQSIKAMQLWNDWNMQVYEWGMTQQKLTLSSSSSSSSSRRGGGVDYLLLRSEDLLHPETRLDALLTLANFVGSSLTKEELCCLSRRGTIDFGTSHHSSGGGGGGGSNSGGGGPQRQESTLHEKQPEGESEKDGSFVQRSSALRVRQARLEQRANELDKREKMLQERQKQLDQRMADLVQRDDRKQKQLQEPLQQQRRKLLQQQQQQHEQQQHYETLRNTTDQLQERRRRRRRRRQLTTMTAPNVHQYEQHQGARPAHKMVATSFFREYDRFQEGVAMAHQDPSGTTKEIFQGYIEMGQRLEQLWELNKATIADSVPLEDITAQLVYLQYLATKEEEEQQQIQPPQSDYSLDNGLKAVQQRYGKWKTQLAQNSELSHYLHQEGGAALKLFGYEPYCLRFVHTGTDCNGNHKDKYEHIHHWNVAESSRSQCDMTLCGVV